MTAVVPVPAQNMARLDRIMPHPLNPRGPAGDVSQLVLSIEQDGLKNPLLVCEAPRRPGWWVLLDGHRRLAACAEAGLKTVPVTITAPPRTGAEAILWMLLMDFHHEQVTPIQRARALGRLRDNGMRAGQIAASLSITPQTVSYHLQLLDLDEPSQARVDAGQIPVGQAHKAVTKARHRAGRRVTGVKVEPAHFTWDHPLARVAALMCGPGHRARPKLHGVACEQCWEAAIRDDTDTGGESR